MCGEFCSSGNIATIVCSGSVGLSFTSMVELKIDSLAFALCTRRYATILPGSSPGIVNVALLLQSTQHTELDGCFFHDNIGTALVVNNTNITLAGNTKFAHTRFCSSIIHDIGGAIIALSSKVTFTGNTTFLDNSEGSPRQCSLYNIATNVLGGAIYTLDNTIITFSGTNYFIMNKAASGGAIFVSHNTALIFSGTNYFVNNSAGEGGAIYTYEGTISFSRTNYFINNSATGGGAISTSAATVSFTRTNKFINNIAYSCGGGAIFSSENNALIFNGTVNFTNNACRSASELNGRILGGGGLYMGLKSTFSVLLNTSVYWKNNHASLGGAIYVQDASPISYCTLVVPKEECFFQLPGQNLSNGIDVKLVFQNNSADDAGSVLYGGAIDNCKLLEFTGLDSCNSGEVFDMIVHNNDSDYISSSNISSDPLQICLCENHLLDCNKWQSVYYKFPHTVYPGETFHISVVAVGQRNGAVPSTVRSGIDQHINPGDTLDPQYVQRKTDNTCTTLSYVVLSLGRYLWLELHAEHNPCDGELRITVY